MKDVLKNKNVVKTIAIGLSVFAVMSSPLVAMAQDTDERAKEVTEKASEISGLDFDYITGETENIGNDENGGNIGDIELITINDAGSPLAAQPIDEEKISWWWLIIIAILGATGYELYKRHREKKLAKAKQNHDRD
jgi:hypothetical protein